MAMLIGIGALLLLLASIAWDGRRIANSQPAVLGEKKSRVKSNFRANAFAAVALLAAVMALSEYFQPRVLPFTGRWSVVYEFGYAMGPFGLVLYWTLLGAAFAVAAVAAWRAGSRS